MKISTATKKLTNAGATIISDSTARVTAMLNGYMIAFDEQIGAVTNCPTNIRLGYTGGSDKNYWPSLTAAIKHCN